MSNRAGQVTGYAIKSQGRAWQGRAGYAKKLTGQGRVRLRKYQQGRLQVTKIPYPAELYSPSPHPQFDPVQDVFDTRVRCKITFFVE
jgi:hypothetical protein